MAKPDGRVEKGQSLKLAISATRWNDMCDAADIVHGRRGGVTADRATQRRYCISAPIKITTTTEYPHPGVAVQYASTFSAYGANFSNLGTSWPRPEHHGGINFLEGTIPEAVNIATNELEAATMPTVFAVTLEPKPQGQAVVNCAIAGICFAHVRVISSYHRFVSLPRNRGSSIVDQAGLLETSDTGVSMIIAKQNQVANGIAIALVRL